MKKGTYLFMTCLMIILFVGCSRENNINQEEQLSLLQEQMDQQKTMIDSLESDKSAIEERLQESIERREEAEAEAILLKEELQNKENEAAIPAYTLGETYLSQSYETIIDDFMERNDVIETPGSLGGTMRFTEAYVLTDRLILGKFDDGHTEVTGVFEYWTDQTEQLQYRSVEEFITGQYNMKPVIDENDEWSVWEYELYQARYYDELLDLYRENLDGAYSDGYGSRLLEFYQKLGVYEFARGLYDSEIENPSEVIGLLAAQIQIYGDIYGITVNDFKNDLETLTDEAWNDALEEWISHSF